MSPVIAFDIAVVAQKVKVQCCYILADMLNHVRELLLVVCLKKVSQGFGGDWQTLMTKAEHNIMNIY